LLRSCRGPGNRCGGETREEVPSFDH
jgi:hypothetical protein